MNVDRAASLDVIVVGSGLAGLTVTLSALEAGHRVTLITKGLVNHSNTAWAQGGIAAAVSREDEPVQHAADTMRAGAGLSVPESVTVLTEGGADAIHWLEQHGVRFDRNPDGTLALAREAAHGRARVVHSGGDATGAGVVNGLLRTLAAWSSERDGDSDGDHCFTLHENTAVTDLVLDSGRVCGVQTLNRDGVTVRVTGDLVVLATGGAGQLYAHTTNPTVATADGIALAMRAGAEVEDLEFIQFHPTSLAAGAGGLISEAVRGAGAVLRDQDGRRFMVDLHPDAELAPRDVVARSIAAVMNQQAAEPVYLDATGLSAEALGAPAGTSLREALAKRFPTIHDECVSAGIEWWHEWVPVTPAAHYMMGGVVTDVDGRTTVPGLWAVGEVARTGVHGANRLASNSLLEAVVFGRRVVDGFDRDGAGSTKRSPLRPSVAMVEPVVATRERVVASREPAASRGEPAAFSEFSSNQAGFTRASLQRLMWRDVGLVRTAEGLRRATTQIERWLTSFPVRVSTVSELEDRNLLQVAHAVATAALERPQSVGAHYLADTSVPTVVQVRQ